MPDNWHSQSNAASISSTEPVDNIEGLPSDHHQHLNTIKALLLDYFSSQINTLHQLMYLFYSFCSVDRNFFDDPLMGL